MLAASACLAGAVMHPIAQVRPRVHSRHRATRLCDPAPQAWLQRGSAVFDSFGARAEDLSTVCEAEAQRMRQSMDTDGDGIVSASEVLAFARNVAAAEAATAVKAVRVRCDRLPAVPASVLQGKPPFVAATIYNIASMYNLLLGMGDAAGQLLSRLSLGAAKSVGLVLLDLIAAAAFSRTRSSFASLPHSSAARAASPSWARSPTTSSRASAAARSASRSRAAFGAGAAARASSVRIASACARAVASAAAAAAASRSAAARASTASMLRIAPLRASCTAASIFASSSESSCPILSRSAAASACIAPTRATSCAPRASAAAQPSRDSAAAARAASASARAAAASSSATAAACSGLGAKSRSWPGSGVRVRG